MKTAAMKNKNTFGQKANGSNYIRTRFAKFGIVVATLLTAFSLVSNTARVIHAEPPATSPMFEVEAGTFASLAKLQATDGVTGDQFGGSTAISGDTAVIGANAIGGTVSGPGAAYVYVRNGGNWTLQQKLTASDGAPEDAFGSSVAISGDTIVVGAYSDTVGTNTSQGSAYVFVRSGTAWTQQQKLVAGDGASFDIFGRTVAISGDTVAVGASSDDITTNVDQGSAYIFLRTGSTWAQQQKLLAGDGTTSDFFGDSITIEGNTVLIGATDDTTGVVTQQGSAYVFVRTGTTWAQQQKLTANDGTTFDYFGFSVALSGDTAVIGTLQDIGATFQQGSAYVYVRSGTTWTQQQKLLANDGAANDSFGNSVSVLGDTVLIGAAGDTNGTNPRQGSAYVFSRTGTTWTQQQKLTASDGTADDSFGASVSLTPDAALIGSLGDSIGSNVFQGSAYLFAPSVTVSGRVTTPSGLNIRNAVVAITDSVGVRRTTTTSSFGIYTFTNVRVNETYILGVASKQYRFAPVQMLITDNITNLNFVGQE